MQDNWRLALAVVSLAAMSCPAPSASSCTSSSCAGCCAADGVCQPGVSDGACGHGGLSCAPCGAGAVCSSGICVGANVGGGTGSGGGIGTHQQEVVSGSRLKAIHLTGDDGSRMSSVNAFYDTQLQLYCSVSYPPGLSSPLVWPLPAERCFPLFLLSERTNCFTDTVCQTRCPPFVTSSNGFSFTIDAALYGHLLPIYYDGGVGSRYAVLGDGGWALVSGLTTQETPEYYLQPDAGCRFNTNVSSGTVAATVTPVPITTFVAFTPNRD